VLSGLPTCKQSTNGLHEIKFVLRAGDQPGFLPSNSALSAVWARHWTEAVTSVHGASVGRPWFSFMLKQTAPAHSCLGRCDRGRIRKVVCRLGGATRAGCSIPARSRSDLSVENRSETKSIRKLIAFATHPPGQNDPIQAIEARILIKNGCKPSPAEIEKSLRARERAGKVDPRVAQGSNHGNARDSSPIWLT